MPPTVVLLWLLVTAMAVAGLAGAPVRAGEALAGLVALGASVTLAGMSRARPRIRHLGVPLAVGTGAYGLGWFAWMAICTADHAAGGPTVADALWLTFYPSAMVALVLAMRREAKRVPATAVLDVAAASLAVAAVGVEFFVTPLVAGGIGSSLALVVSAAYPTLDVVLAATLVATAVVLGWNWPTRLAAAGLAAFLAADYAYFTSVADQAHGVPWQASTPVSLGIVLLVTAVAQPLGRSGRRDDRSAVITPAVFASIALAVLVLGHVRPIGDETTVLAAGAIAAALARLVATVRLERALRTNRRLALTDELTGLPNRRALTHAVDQRLAAGKPVALVLLDLDGFKEVNDSLGHVAGDDLLPLVGHRLGGVLADGEVLARLGGDEFAALVPATAGERRASEMLAALSEPFDVGALAVHVGASAGVASWPDHGRTPFELLRRADEAMYRAKAARGTVAVAADHDAGRGRRRIELLGELGAALSSGEVRPYFQPQVTPGDGRLVGVEALARWAHPRHGLVPPVLFLPGRAQGGLGRALTRCMVDAAAEHAAAWRAAGRDVPVSVNLCAADLADDGLLQDVVAACARHGLPPAALRLEVTETVVMADPDAGVARLEQLRRAGFGLALDDFGTDHSSLAYLDEMPVDELKIDRGFVARLDRVRTAQIVASTVDLAHRLGLRTVAEGVELPAQHEALAAMGVDAMQGWLFSPAVPGPELLAQAALHQAAV